MEKIEPSNEVTLQRKPNKKSIDCPRFASGTCELGSFCPFTHSIPSSTSDLSFPYFVVNPILDSFAVGSVEVFRWFWCSIPSCIASADSGSWQDFPTQEERKLESAFQRCITNAASVPHAPSIVIGKWKFDFNKMEMSQIADGGLRTGVQRVSISSSIPMWFLVDKQPRKRGANQGDASSNTQSNVRYAFSKASSSCLEFEYISGVRSSFIISATDSLQDDSITSDVQRAEKKLHLFVNFESMTARVLLTLQCRSVGNDGLTNGTPPVEELHLYRQPVSITHASPACNLYGVQNLQFRCKAVDDCGNELFFTSTKKSEDEWLPSNESPARISVRFSLWCSADSASPDIPECPIQNQNRTTSTLQRCYSQRSLTHFSSFKHICPFLSCGQTCALSQTKPDRRDDVEFDTDSAHHQRVTLHHKLFRHSLPDPDEIIPQGSNVPRMEERKPTVEERKPTAEERKPTVEERKPTVEERKPTALRSESFSGIQSSIRQAMENRLCSLLLPHQAEYGSWRASQHVFRTFRQHWKLPFYVGNLSSESLKFRNVPIGSEEGNHLGLQSLLDRFPQVQRYENRSLAESYLRLRSDAFRQVFEFEGKSSSAASVVDEQKLFLPLWNSSLVSDILEGGGRALHRFFFSVEDCLTPTGEDTDKTKQKNPVHIVVCCGFGGISVDVPSTEQYIRSSMVQNDLPPCKLIPDTLSPKSTVLNVRGSFFHSVRDCRSIVILDSGLWYPMYIVSFTDKKT